MQVSQAVDSARMDTTYRRSGHHVGQGFLEPRAAENLDATSAKTITVRQERDSEVS